MNTQALYAAFPS